MPKDSSAPNATNGMRDPASSENRRQPIHRWVPWVAGFSGQFVGDIIDRFIVKNGNHQPLIMDPFCGVGTTLVEARSHGLDSVGFEINPYAALAAEVKANAFLTDCAALSLMISEDRKWMGYSDTGIAWHVAKGHHKPVSKPPAGFKSRIPFFSEDVLPQVLATQEFISALDDVDLKRTFLVALGSVMVKFSNYSYEPSLSTRPGSGKVLVTDAPVAEIIGENQMRCSTMRSRCNGLFHGLMASLKQR